LLITSFLLFSTNLTKAGNEKNDSTRYSITATYNQGITLFENILMSYFVNDFAKNVEIGIVRNRYQSDVWEKEFKNLDIGASLWFSTFGRKDILGEGIVLKTFANFHIFQLGKLNTKYHLTFGPAYVTKIYDQKQNYYNSSLSTRLNAYSSIGLNLSYLATDRLSFTGNFTLHHISNGSFKKPNIGITQLNLGIGAKYDLNPKPLQPPVYYGKTPFKARGLMGTFGLGANQASLYHHQKYLSGSVSLTHLWYINKTKTYGLGIDFIHLGGAPFTALFIDDEEINKENTFSNNLYIGLNGTIESHLGSTSPYLTIGYKVYNKIPFSNSVYGRIGFRQKIYKNLSAHFSINVKIFSSEFMEFGLAYRFIYKEL